MTALAAERATRPEALVHCHGETDWNVLAGQWRFNASGVLAFVPVRFIWLYQIVPIGGYYWLWGTRVPAGTEYYMHVSPTTCWYGDEFLGAADKRAQKTCSTTHTEYVTETVAEVVTKRIKKLVPKRKRVWVTVTARKNGETVRVRKRVWKTVKVWVTVEKEVVVEREEIVPQEVVTTFECKDWLLKVEAVQTFVHEAEHIRGERNEAAAECYAMQSLAWAAWKHFGADAALAREMATDFWTHLYPRNQGTQYWSPECRDGGQLDLRPNSSGWPSG